MNRFFSFVLTAVILAGPIAAHSEAGQRKGVNLALVPSVQIFNDQAEVTGMRINFVGSNISMTGLDIGVVNMVKNRFSGAAFGIGNSVTGYAKGLQMGCYNFAGESHGLQLGVLNRSAKLEGVQFGIANYANENNRLQFGFINIANNHLGWQIGLMNFNTEPSASFPGMIFVNGSF